MTKTTVSTAGAAMPKIDRSALMARAWAIFRKTYHYPQIKFSDIGRNCFAWALRQAQRPAMESDHQRAPRRNSPTASSVKRRCATTQSEPDECPNSRPAPTIRTPQLQSEISQ